MALDSEKDVSHLDTIVINAFQIGEEVSVMTLFERCAFKLDRHALRRTLLRLMSAERVRRRASGGRRDGYFYTRLT